MRVASCSVALIGPGVYSMPGGPWTLPETLFNSADCSEGRAAVVTLVRPQPSCLASREVTYELNGMGQVKALMRPICLHIHENISSCMAVDTFTSFTNTSCRDQWLRGIGRRAAAPRLLKLWVRIPPGEWVSLCCDTFVLSGIGLCDKLITCPEES